mgnify:FL=1
MTDCIFCKIVAGSIPAKVVYEDDLVIAFHDIAPKADTHLLVIPKEHVVNLDDLRAEHGNLMQHLLFSIPNIAQQQQLDGYRTITNTGEGGGQEVFHMHFHILAGAKLPGF